LYRAGAGGPGLWIVLWGAGGACYSRWVRATDWGDAVADIGPEAVGTAVFAAVADGIDRRRGGETRGGPGGIIGDRIAEAVGRSRAAGPDRRLGQTIAIALAQLDSSGHLQLFRQTLEPTTEYGIIGLDGLPTDHHDGPAVGFPHGQRRCRGG
jgi:hypothetical protein